MIRLQTKLSLFNFISKLLFTAVFIILMPYIIERINILQTDKELVKKREQIMDLFSDIGLEPFITADSADAFGSYNILKDEFISLERIDLSEDWDFIEVTKRIIDDEIINYRVLNYSFKADDQTYLLEVGKSLSSIQDSRKNISKVIWIFLIFIILITLLSDLYFSHKLLRPLDMIISKLKGISTPQNYDKTPVKTTTSDFYSLDQALNDLMNRIYELFKKEKEITVNISHELMTPISVIRSKLENLLLQDNLDHETSDRIEESLGTLHRLKTLVNSLLSIARIESQQYLKEDSFSINELLAEVMKEISPVAEDSEIILKSESDKDLLISNANKSLIFSMFYNVVNNAVKNTESHGTVLVKSGFFHKRFGVSIADTGKGMTEEQQKYLFSRFRNRLSVDEKGYGIGLAITKSIADFHNIDIIVKSEIGNGTTFSFLFSENS
jgi:signal transduction histidine kinase